VSRPLRVLGALLAAVALIVVVAVFGLSSTSSPAGGLKAPALPGERLVGPSVSIASLAASGRPSLVVFWASWCGPCQHEAAAIERFSQSAAGRGRIVGVDWSDARSGAKSFIRRYGWTFPVLRDGEGKVGNEYRMADLPTTFVVSAKGRIAAKLTGPQTEATLGRALAAAEDGAKQA
jgi:cytochrome c biogenesis protein CcmG, thiol:disulfide interchange protein DsbE